MLPPSWRGLLPPSIRFGSGRPCGAAPPIRALAYSPNGRLLAAGDFAGALWVFETATGRASFLLHWRDPAKVGHAGGMYQVIPVGVFQPSGEASWYEREDFSLWRCMLREFDEELRDTPDEYGAGPVDYGSWPFARHMAAALDRGQIRVWCLGLGVDPLTYAADLLTVAVIDSRVFDELFSLDPRGNAEGRVLAAREFAADDVDRIVTREPVQAAGAAVLRLAWRHREVLTS